ncbi:conserved Plasmodium protein, unknown function [Plasmodium reichenowi]|uniref:Uncharacterized protein n=1 Tax=Plasmodium reichenowi TaxID=5854 RepID=A0A2P9DHT4_PLARE|nr:conserved Plasmodium protein, unknown function [Plasmodium reichenowi]
MEEPVNTIKKIKSNMSKICFNKSNKLNADFKDDHIEIILDNKNITPKPIYFNFQEAETKKSFDQIDELLKQFDEKNNYTRNDTQKKIVNKEDEEQIKDILNTEKKKKIGKREFFNYINKKRDTKWTPYEKEISDIYDEIILCESETIVLLNIPNTLNDIDEEKLKVEEKNKLYEKLLNNDESNYISKSMQTLSVFKKNKDIYVSTINKQSKSTQTNLYELYKLTIMNPTDISQLLHKRFVKYRNKKLKKIMDEYGDSLNINERVILKKNMWVQVVDKNVADNKQTTIIPKSFYKSRKNNTSLFNTLFMTKNISRTFSNKSRTMRTKSRYKNMKTMKFLTSSFSEDEYLIKSIIKKKKEENDIPEEDPYEEDNSRGIPWIINNKKKKLNKSNFILLIKQIEKCIVQNIYVYQQMIYKNIHLNYLRQVENYDVKMFDGENYDALTNPNINYKKKRILIKIKIKKNMKKLCNLKTKIKDINKMKGDISKQPNHSNDTISINSIKHHIKILSKKKKEKIAKKIFINKLKNNIRKKIKKKKKKKKYDTNENNYSGFQKNKQNIDLTYKRNNNDHINVNKNMKITNDPITGTKTKDGCSEGLLENNTSVENFKKIEDDKIFDILINDESKEDKLKKISTIIIDDVLLHNKKKKSSDLLERDNFEKKKFEYILKRKKGFTTINVNRLKLIKEVKQDYIYKYYNNNILNDHVYNNININNDNNNDNSIFNEYTNMLDHINEDSNNIVLDLNNNIEDTNSIEYNNILYKRKKKKYIKNISINKLFQFHYNKLENIVTSIDTNKFYKDYISSSYSNTLDIGSFQNSKGNIAIFSFINPNYPLKLYNVNCSVMKIKYSKNNPNLLVSALSNGHIYIYDIRQKDETPVLKSTTIKNYYENCYEPIYDLSFKNQYTNNNSFENIFYSAHENGCVYQWNIEKELKTKEILYLKNKKNDLYQDLSSVFVNKNLVNKPFNSSLTCIDIDYYMHHDEDFIISNIEKNDSSEFNKNENNPYVQGNENKNIQQKKDLIKKSQNKLNHKTTPLEKDNYNNYISKEEELLNHYKNITKNIIDKKIKPTHSYYYIGTKNGIIYRCNSCYQKSYLNYYIAHFGAVNRIKINKFDHDIFLSAGEDCTVKLWNRFRNTQITTFKSKNAFSSINDIIWSPNNSTSFFCCSDDGRIELWDFDFFSKDPLIIFYPNNLEASKITTLKMFNKEDILLCGDNLANVSMMKIKNLFNLKLDEYEQKMKLTNCLNYLDTYDYF